MNVGNQPFISIRQDCDSVVEQISAALKSAGYFVMQSFDLHTAAQAHHGCQCEEDLCSCQMVVLLVYSQNCSPATLLFASQAGVTSVYLVDSQINPLQTVWIERLTQFFPDNLSPADTIIPWVEPNDCYPRSNA
jgi:hypothetical protein